MKDLEGIVGQLIVGLSAELEYLPLVGKGAPPAEEVMETVKETIGSLKEAREEMRVWSSPEILMDTLGELSTTGISASLYLLKEYYVVAENRGNDEPMGKFLARFVGLKTEHSRLRATLTGERGVPTKRKEKETSKRKKDFGFGSPDSSEDESGKGGLKKTLREMLESD